MDLGLFMQPLHDPKKHTITEMLDQDREAALYADAVGFDELWVGEHYTSCIEPIVNPLQFMSSLIHSTKLRFATGVINIPQHHPAQVAGDVAMFDHMSKGRLIMGVSAGGLASDFELFDTTDKNRAEMLVESVDMIHKIWATDPPYNISGKYWNIKVDESIKEELGFGPMLKPYQKPFPPVYLAIMSPNSGSARQAAMRGWGIASANFIQASCAKSHWEQYLIGCDKAGIRPDHRKWSVGRSILVTETDSEAADYLAEDDNSYAWYYNFVIDDMRAYNIMGALKTHAEMPESDINLKYCLDSMVLSGSANTVLDKLVAFVDYVGPFGTLLSGFKEWDRPDLQKGSMRRLAQEVMPKLRDYCNSKRIAAE